MFPRLDVAALQALLLGLDGGVGGWACITECSCFGSSNGLSRPESGKGPCDGQPDTTVEKGRSSSICSGGNLKSEPFFNVSNEVGDHKDYTADYYRAHHAYQLLAHNLKYCNDPMCAWWHQGGTNDLKA